MEHARHLVLELPGGGGYCDPTMRTPELVKQDIEREYISAAQARED